MGCVKVAAYQAPLLPTGSMGALDFIRARVRACEAEGVEILCCPEAILGGLADHIKDPARLAISVYVQSFKSPVGRIRVSTNGAGQPRWRADGRELFYRDLDGAMMSVDMTDPAKPGAPRKLFDLRFWVNPLRINTT